MSWTLVYSSQGVNVGREYSSRTIASAVSVGSNPWRCTPSSAGRQEPEVAFARGPCPSYGRGLCGCIRERDWVVPEGQRRRVGTGIPN